jgi:hypothetical protein
MLSVLMRLIPLTGHDNFMSFISMGESRLLLLAKTQAKYGVAYIIIIVFRQTAFLAETAASDTRGIIWWNICIILRTMQSIFKTERFSLCVQ